VEERHSRRILPKQTGRSLFWLCAYAAVLAFIGCALVARFDPEKGFTRLVLFGDRFDNGRIEDTGAHIHAASAGYDGQFYAKLALNPLLLEPFADKELDNPRYRARRILASWVAAIAGWGDPKTTIHAYAALNIAAWFLLAAVLIRWFPPVSLHNFVGWSGVLLSTGAVWSVLRSLVDVPSLLLLAVALALLESGRARAGTVVLGISGLAKETNLLGVAGFTFTPAFPRDDLRRCLVSALIVFGPLALWMVYVHFNLVPHGAGEKSPGFALPGVELARKWASLPAYFRDEHYGLFLGNLLPLSAVTVQAVFIGLSYRCWRNPWWRIGIVYAVLLLFLGPDVLAGTTGAYTRAMLPLTLCFNVLAVSSSRTNLAILLAGNAWLVCPVAAFVVE